MALLQLVYTSLASVPLSREELRALVRSASKSNRDHRITGMLQCADNAYLQVLEGDEKNVLTLYANILNDERHHDIHTVVIRPIEQRSFPNWAMGLVDKLQEPIDLNHVLNRAGDRVGVWNHAGWPEILNTFRAELELVDP